MRAVVLIVFGGQHLSITDWPDPPSSFGLPETIPAAIKHLLTLALFTRRGAERRSLHSTCSPGHASLWRTAVESDCRSQTKDTLHPSFLTYLPVAVF